MTNTKRRKGSPKRWFHPKIHSGWDKRMETEERRALMLKAHKGNYLATARALQALANVNSGPRGDSGTNYVAGIDARYFFRAHKIRTRG